MDGHDRIEQRLLVRIVFVKIARRDIRLLSYLCKACPQVAVSRKALAGCTEDSLPDFVLEPLRH